MDMLIDTYVREVGRHLPEKNRVDIEKEIRSAIEDALDDMSQTQGRPRDQAMIVEILKRMGPPEKMAASYLPPRYLVGPQLYPIFILVMRIVMTVLVILGAVGFGVALSQTAPASGAVLEVAARSLAQIINSIMLALGMIVLIFAILQQALPEIKKRKTDWDPLKMKPVKDSDYFGISEPVVKIVFTLIGLIICNLYPQLIGIGYVANGQWYFTPVLSDGFYKILPLLNILWVADIIFNLILLQRGRWETGTRIFDMVLDIYRIAVVYLMITGPALVHIDPAALAQAGMTPEKIQSLAILPGLFNGSIQLGLAVALVVMIVGLARKVYTLLRRGTLMMG